LPGQAFAISSRASFNSDAEIGAADFVERRFAGAGRSEFKRHLVSSRIAARAAIARMVIALLRNTCTAFFPGKRLNETIDLRYVATCVFLAQVDGRPLSATKLARATGMPRPTLLRKLGVLMDIGYIKRVGRLYFVTEKANLPNLPQVVARNVRIVETTCKELYKMGY
jgi:DNA-binding transcriptional ArsR family regulator